MNTVIRNTRLPEDKQAARRDIYIAGGSIAGIGEPPAGFEPKEVIDGSRKVCMPGLVNAHTHAYMSVFRNYADDLPFAQWLFEKIAPLEDRMTSEQAYWGNMLSIMEMIRTGTTCFVDMHMFPHMSVKACADSGMRALLSRGLVGSDRHDEGGLRRLREAMEEKEAAEESEALVRFALGPHAIYTCGEDFLRFLAETAQQQGMMINMHLSETQDEFDKCIQEHGMTPVAYVQSLGLLEVPSILAHCVYLTDEDMEILSAPGVSVAANPASNMKLGNGFAPVARMLQQGINVCLGTDGASSNNGLNMFREMGLLTLSQKGATKDSLVLKAEETVRIAARNGWRAVGLESLHPGREETDGVFSLYTGMPADLILLDEEAPNFQPKHNWHSAIAYSSTGYEVTDTIVGGEILMKDRQLKTIDEERVNYEIARAVKDF